LSALRTQRDHLGDCDGTEPAASDAPRSELRPTRDALSGTLRPTRDAAEDAFSVPLPFGTDAPFVTAPIGPRVAPAPRVALPSALANVPPDDVSPDVESSRAAHGDPPRTRAGHPAVIESVPLESMPPESMPLESMPLESLALGSSAVVLDDERAQRALASLRRRGVLPMVGASDAPAGVGASSVRLELVRTLRRATGAATIAGVLGAMLGALVVRQDAFLPPWGWLPGALAGAALFAGALGALGFVLGAASLLFARSTTLARLARPSGLTVVAVGRDAATVEATLRAIENERVDP
jgi:hypothetical protein